MCLSDNPTSHHSVALTPNPLPVGCSAHFQKHFVCWRLLSFSGGQKTLYLQEVDVFQRRTKKPLFAGGRCLWLETKTQGWGSYKARRDLFAGRTQTESYGGGFAVTKASLSAQQVCKTW